jgi:hypothetical protein
MCSCVSSRRRTKNLPADCHPSRNSFRSLEEIVQDYIDNCRARTKEELDHFRGQRHFVEAMRVSALAITRDRKRHSHQRRIPRDLLEEFRWGLSRRRRALRSCKTFPELMAICETVAAGIWKNSRLTVYDTAHRIGMFLGVRPDLVYLHTGAKEGAKALGFKGSLPHLDPRQFPKAFRRLAPYEIENCLCIYKDALKLLR